MQKKIKVVDLSYYHEKDVSNYQDLMRLYEPGSGHHQILGMQVDLHVIRLLNLNDAVKINGVNYYFLKGNSSKLWLPRQLHRLIKYLDPDVILIHGFLMPLQVFLLKLQIKAPVIIQYHGGGAPSGITGLLNKWVKRFIQAYVFTAHDQTNEFIEKRLMNASSMIYEVMEGSTHKRKGDKQSSREHLGIDEKETMFLWVGRLDENKDPLVVISGFEQLCTYHRNLRLYMVYNDDKLLNQVKSRIKMSAQLAETIVLVGELHNTDLDGYYNSADIFVLGSHYEGSGFALCEAMACGCIPLVTDIPSFRRMTDQGRLGSLWMPGDKESLVISAEKILGSDRQKQSEATVRFFEQELSFEAIALKQSIMFSSVLTSTK